MKRLKKKRPSEIILEVPRQTIGLFPEFLNVLSAMSVFILVVIFYRGIQNHIINFKEPTKKTISIAKVQSTPIAAPKVIEVQKSEVERISYTVETEISKSLLLNKPTLRIKAKGITRVKSVFRFKYKKEDAVSVEDFNFFRPSSYSISRGGKKRLRKLAPYLKNQTILIHGHTDPVPAKFIPARSWNTNEELSMLRAKSIKKYLISRGLKAKQIRIGTGRKIHPKNPEGSRGATFILK